MTFYLLETLGRGSYVEAHWQLAYEGGSFGVQGFFPPEGDMLPSLILNEAAFTGLVDSEERLAVLVAAAGMAIFRYDETFGGNADAIAEMVALQGDALLARLDPMRMISGRSA